MAYAATNQPPARHTRFDRLNARIHLWHELQARGFFGTTCYCEHDLGPFTADLWLREAKTAILIENGSDLTKRAGPQNEWMAHWLKRFGIQLLCFDAAAILEERAAILQSVCRLVEARLKVA